MDKESLEKMEEVETFLDNLIEDYQECRQLHFDEDCVSVMYGYAAALINWEKMETILEVGSLPTTSFS